MNCDKCLYSTLCKYEEDARKFEEIIKKFAKENDDVIKPACLELCVKCNNFRMKYNNTPRSV
jgi:hypothetical protein